jgi:hypothetical protein
MANGNFSFMRSVLSITYITDNSHEIKGQISQDVTALKMCYGLMKNGLSSTSVLTCYGRCHLLTRQFYTMD